MLETAKALQAETPCLKYVLPLANKITITGTTVPGKVGATSFSPLCTVELCTICALL